MQSSVSSLQFFFSLLGSVKKPYSSDHSEIAIRHWIEDRAKHFLQLCNSEVFSKPGGIFGKLFSWAVISQDQLHSMVADGGLEKTLLQLAQKGVSLDIDEFKGRKPVVRPGLRMMVDASDLDMVRGPSMPFLSSGSSGKRLRTLIGMPGMGLLASCIPPVLKYLEAEDLPVVLNYPMPSGSGFMHLITFSLIGKPPSAWFAQGMDSPWWSSKSGMKLAALIAGFGLRGIRLPAPRLASIQQPIYMAEWLKRNCPKGAVVPSFTGSAIHLVRTAVRTGISLPPLVFLLGGEPLTDRKRQALEQEGHRVFPWYSSVETGRLALGCLTPSHADDMHVLEDRIACVVRPRPVDVSGEKRPVLLFTTLHPDSYKFLLNVETGDEAAIGEGRCGCPWENLGFSRRLYNVRSFEKLTLEGISLVADFLAEMVEEEIPSRCGGTPADYQFTEEEASDGVTHLVLSVNPAVNLDIARITGVVQELFDKKFNMISTLMINAASITVRREVPKLTQSGKMLTVRSGIKEKSN
jgi:hypothetical protein